MSQLGVILQESLRTQSEPRTILGLLTEQMDGVDEGSRRRRSFKERLGFIGMGCCGATWGFRSASLTVRDDGQQEQPHQQQHQLHETDPGQDPNGSGPECVGPTPAGSSMNLAAALAAERQLRGPQEEPGAGGEGSRDSVPGTPWRVSLMRLLEETEGGGDAAEVVEEEKREGGGGAVGNDSVCCVCMGRKKGAAFIPCGHTFCRVCSRELWLNRGSCPLCNRSILEILDIF
ncbi:uncharacterized protein LOC133287266 [Gastrolobium bilobum]|uniref:uncharacterized protein LOC133287266 n=1 Tax=Gastrolobium bilobum TaxID=150636 RepID=UPI002AB00023|nr:uncharacterized protein LOC133287266 [Gastrolobium bilobum]